ncbi:MAG: P1 family peptidase [Pseudomonadota bacterium]
MAVFTPGPKNLITDVQGLRVGHAQDEALKSGVTALICDCANRACVHVMGGAPGSRETDLLAPENTVERVDALVLAGGSAFGLDAAAGVQDVLKDQGRGFEVGPHRIPIVPAAILFDLINGGDKDWGDYNPYRALGRAAVQNADETFALGSVGAGTGATCGGPAHNGVFGIKGGLGSASTTLSDGTTVGALVAVNALGSPLSADGAAFRAAPFELAGEFGGHGSSLAGDHGPLPVKFRGNGPSASIQSIEQANTTIAIVATDAQLSKAGVKRLCMAAHDGFARALWPAHTPLDGDLIFGLATGDQGCDQGGHQAKNLDLDHLIDLSAAAAATMARAIARGVFSARARPNDIFPVWNALSAA